MKKVVIGLGFFFVVAFIAGCAGEGGAGPGGSVPNAQDVIFVANSAAQTLMVIDMASGFNRTATAGLSSGVNDMHLRPDTNQLWVLHTLTPEMRVYSVPSDKTLPPVFVTSYSLDLFQGGASPENFAFSNAGKVFYVTSWNYSCVSIRDANTNADYNDLQVGTRPEGVTVLPNGKVVVAITAYLGQLPGGGSSYGAGEVVLCDSACTQVIRRDTVSINPRVIRYYNNALYVVCSGDFNNNLGMLWKLDPNTLQSLATPLVFNGAYPGDLAIDVDTTGVAWGVLPAVSGTETGAQGIFIVNLTTWHVQQSLSVNGNPFRAVALPHGGVAVSMESAAQILVRLRDGTTYTLRAEQPLAIAAAAK